MGYSLSSGKQSFSYKPCSTYNDANKKASEAQLLKLDSLLQVLGGFFPPNNYAFAVQD
jgi:hypothetical protein